MSSVARNARRLTRLHRLRLGVSLRTRLTVWYGALLALTLLGFSALVYFTLERSLYTSTDDALRLRAGQIRRVVLGPGVGSSLQPEDIPPRQVEGGALDEFAAPGIYPQVINARGGVVFAPANLGGGELPIAPESLAALQSGRETLVTVPLGELNVRVLTVPVHGPRGDVVGGIQVGQSLAPLEGTMATVARQLLTTGAAALLTAVIIGWVLTRRALSPVTRITATARHIAATGDYGQRLPVPARAHLGPGDELYSMATTFNAMIARLEQLLESQRRLLADTSHELRNPLTIIRGNLALLRRSGPGQVPRETLREAVAEADEEAARMGRLVNELLLLARADAGQAAPIRRDAIDLPALVGEVVEQARPRAGNRTVTFDAQAAAHVAGDRDRLKQLAANLLENALRYTPDGGRIQVRVAVGVPVPDAHPHDLQHPRRSVRSTFPGPSPSPDAAPHLVPDFAPPPLPLPDALADIAFADPRRWVVLSVADSGIGVEPEHLPHLFERFYRADRARSRAEAEGATGTGTGSGLGLPIAQYIAQAHGGAIGVHSAGPGQGSVFTVLLPLLADATAGDTEVAAAPDSRPMPGRGRDPQLARARNALHITRTLLVAVLATLALLAAPIAGSAAEPAAPSNLIVDGDGNLLVTDYQGDRVVKFNPDGQVLLQWGVRGAGTAQFSGPFGIAVDRDSGAIFVVDQLNSRIQKFAPDGTFLLAWGEPGAASGQFRTPFGAATLGGSLYVADFGNDRVQVFSSEGSLQRTWGSRGSGEGQFIRPACIAVDREGNVYVSDHFNDRVQKFSADGRYLMQFGNLPPLPAAPVPLRLPLPLSTSTPTAPAPLPDDRLQRPEGVAIDRDGVLYVADYGRDRVARFSADGHFLGAWGVRGAGPGELAGPKGIAVDGSAGRVYVADTGNGRIQRFTLDGAFEAAWGL